MHYSLSAHNLCLQYGCKIVSQNISLDFNKPEIVSIIGPNGSGKSTLLKSLCRLHKPAKGNVLLNGQDIHSINPNKLARIISVLPQSAAAPSDISIYDLVLHGRMPHRGFLQSISAQDREAVDSALQATGLIQMQERSLGALSGGERQRAWLAMALAQQPKILLLDEPTTYLDVHHQLELMDLIVRLHQERQLTVIMVLHDLNHAARYSQRLIAIKSGNVFADGSVQDVFTTEVLESLYGVKALVHHIEHNGQTHYIYFPYTI